jgi:uncharacterized protein
MNEEIQASRFPLRYFGLVFALAVPFWLVGGSKLPGPVNLPVSALTAFVPMTAAAVLVARQDGTAGVKKLFQRVLDFRRRGRNSGILMAVLLPAAIYGTSYLIIRVVGLPLPETIELSLQSVPIFIVLYFVTAVGEELGWTGYATDPMLVRWGKWAGLLLGVLWALWHAVPFLQTGNPLVWVAWQSFKTVVLRMLLVWLYNHTGKSVTNAILYHMVDNVCWSLFPNYGSHYNPIVTGLVTGLALVLVVAANRVTPNAVESVRNNVIPG